VESDGYAWNRAGRICFSKALLPVILGLVPRICDTAIGHDDIETAVAYTLNPQQILGTSPRMTAE
jgi:hypothetical protein